MSIKEIFTVFSCTLGTVSSPVQGPQVFKRSVETSNRIRRPCKVQKQNCRSGQATEASKFSKHFANEIQLYQDLPKLLLPSKVYTSLPTPSAWPPQAPNGIPKRPLAPKTPNSIPQNPWVPEHRIVFLSTLSLAVGL